MTARNCFTAKIKLGKVSERAGKELLATLDEFEAANRQKLGGGAAAMHSAAADASAAVKAEAARKASTVYRTVRAQSDFLRARKAYADELAKLRKAGNAPVFLAGETRSEVFAAARSFLTRDPHEIGTWNNVDFLARDLRGRAHAQFAEAIEFLRPKGLGFKAETARELDVLRALYGEKADPAAVAVADAWGKLNNETLRPQYVEAGGALAERKSWRLPNPPLEAAKVSALGREGFADLVRRNVDRADMLDQFTGKPMNDVKFERLVGEAFDTITRNGLEGPPSGEHKGARLLANERDFGRFFVWKDAEAWQEIAHAIGQHSSVLDTMTSHIANMTLDTAQLRILFNPEAMKRFMLDQLAREPGRLAVSGADMAKGGVKAAAAENVRIQNRAARDAKLLENLFAEVTGANAAPVHVGIAQVSADARSLLVAGQMGSAMISSLSDPATLAMTARFNGLPVMNVVGRAMSLMAEKGSEIYAAQMGLVMDTLAHSAGQVDHIMGDTIRTGAAAKLGTAVVRASGLRRWTASLRNGFGLEMMAHIERVRGTAFDRLDPQFREALGRYGIDAADWKLIQAAEAFEPRRNARFVRPLDIAELGTPEARAASEKVARMINTEMDYAVIEHDHITRAYMLGDSRPGTVSGELRRGIGMYRSFAASLIMLHAGRALARGWDGSRLGHAAATFVLMSLLGAVSMQTKEVLAGRNPLSLDPTTAKGAQAWGKAILQGGGLGAFGDILTVDQSKFGATWAATFAGPQAGAVESVLGDFLLGNLRRAANGEKTRFAGDAAYIAGRYVPGSTLWYGKLAFQRAVLDQLHLFADPRAAERFTHIEDKARKDWGQDYWWRPGKTAPSKMPAFAGQ